MTGPDPWTSPAAGVTLDRHVLDDAQRAEAEHADRLASGQPPAETARRRRIDLTPASEIRPRPVDWLWPGRVAVGMLALLAGREGLGKSSIAYWLAARITRGDLPGGPTEPADVLVCAGEESWEHAIVPRLIAYGADLTRVYRVGIRDANDIVIGLVLPDDLDELREAVDAKRPALLVLDPLISRLSGGLDSHKDAEVRRALEPMTALADKHKFAILGLIHFNKSNSTDPLQMVMASRAFGAIARLVNTVILDPDDETGARRLFGTPKSNISRDDLPAVRYGRSASRSAPTPGWPTSA